MHGPGCPGALRHPYVKHVAQIWSRQGPAADRADVQHASGRDVSIVQLSREPRNWSSVVCHASRVSLPMRPRYILQLVAKPLEGIVSAGPSRRRRSRLPRTHLPVWRNWQTRRIQNPFPAREWRFDSSHRYFLPHKGLRRSMQTLFSCARKPTLNNTQLRLRGPTPRDGVQFVPLFLPY